MKKQFHFAAMALSAIILTASNGIASADTLNFTETGIVDGLTAPVVNLSNATLTSFDTFMFIGGPFSFGDSNGLGIACGAEPLGSCRADWKIDFASDVTNLFFESFAATGGDSVTVSAFLNGGLLSSILVTTNTLVDFSLFGAIDSLLFDDNNSTDAGIGFGDFSFNSASEVPLPAAMPLFILGLGGLAGLARLRKKA